MQNQALASALSRVHQTAQKYGGSILPSREISRPDRELLVRTHWLREIMQGWYMFSRPDVLPGDTSAWYANFWDFVRVYLGKIYGADYCLSAENSIDLHIGNPTIPKQAIAIVKKGGGHPIPLLFDTSILVYADPKNFPPERADIRGIQVMSLSFALCKTTPIFFHKTPMDAEIALNLIKDLSQLVYIIATYGFISAGERIVGAFAALGQHEKATFIADQLKKLGFLLKPINPFLETVTISKSLKVHSPYQARVYSLWAHFRPAIISRFPEAPGVSSNALEYMKQVEEIYLKDAYNSLSIEGYQVNEALIDRVRQNHWNPDLDPTDHEHKNALAARGYYEAFLEVKKALLRILKGEPSGKIVAKELHNWFQSLFSPSVSAGILQQRELLGYRKTQVYIRGSRHVPFPKEALMDAMEAFFGCLEEEEHPAVRVILGHFIFVYIHPYIDGNGRLGRFIMNAMLASGGYPWTIVRVENRSRYLAALEAASVDRDIVPFTQFIAQEMRGQA